MTDTKNQNVITLELSLVEVNMLAEALDHLPHGKVRPLIDKIVAQGNEQLNPSKELIVEEEVDA